MKLAQFAAANFLGVDDVRDGSLVKTIDNIQQGSFGKPDATFTDGSKLSLNKTNCRTLVRLFGDGIEFDSLKGKQIELYLGTVRYKGKEDPSVRVRAAPSLVLEPAVMIDDTIPFE
jgi:hypothetical protein